MADLFKLLISSWNCLSKDEQSELVNRYATRRERRKGVNHISQLQIFKNLDK